MRQLLYSVAVILAVVSVGRAQSPPLNCLDTGDGCIDQCFGAIDGEFQWCGSCQYYINCVNGVTSYIQCPEGLVWNDNAKLCAPTSSTCRECETPAPLCASTGNGCLHDCLGQPDGTYQYCGRCDYFLQCSSGTTFYTACQDLNLEFDNNFKACVSVSTTCSDSPCTTPLPPGDCNPNPCFNGGTCLEQGDGFVCNCPPGYTGQTCLSQSDLCQSVPCLNGGTCYEELGGYRCICPAGFTGQNCQSATDTCLSNPCLNGGTCNSNNGVWSCICPPQYTGQRCELLIDPCRSQPCVNGGTCHNNCGVHTCICPPGWTGPLCSILINNCASNPCLNGGTCQNDINSWTCSCRPGFTGAICVPVDACSSGPCLNGGTCVSDCGVYQCTCPVDFTGSRCETPIGVCVPNNCLNGGTCYPDGAGGSYCTCLIQWTGTICESPNYEERLTCGDLTYAEYPAANGFTRFCYYSPPLSDTVGRSTECKNTITGLPLYGTYANLLQDGGNFGCIVSQNYPADNPTTSALSCNDYYQHDVSLGVSAEFIWLMICVRYPYEGIEAPDKGIPANGTV